jgi:hypothetical protein
MTGEHGIVPVALDASDPVSCDRYRAALATLPASFRLSATADGGVAVVSGATKDWAERALRQLDNGAAALLLVIGEHLNFGGLDAVEQAARCARAVIAADLEYAADPAWISVAATASQSAFGLIDAWAVTDGPVRPAVIRLLVTVAGAVPVLPRFEVVASAPDHAVLGSAGSEAPVTVAATRGTEEGGQQIHLVAREVRYEVSWPGRPRAAPAVAYTHRAAGTTRAALGYEAPERGVWQRLHASLAEGSESGSSLKTLRAVLERMPG